MALNYQIPRNALYWLLALLVLLIAPHAARLPIWMLVLSAVCIVWRLLIHHGKLDYPGRLVRTVLVFSALPLSLIQFRSDGSGVGVDLAVCLLMLGAVFKLLEMRYRRDIYILVALTFMLILTGFIYSQTLVLTLYNLVILVLVVSTMILLNRDSTVEQTSTLRLACVMLLQSLPIMLILFVLVPRIAPLWAMPLPASSSTTGVSDEMTPGEITRLGRSGELAFRVKFNSETPPAEELYWRGLVLDYFDGQTWKRSPGPLLPRQREEVSSATNAFTGSPGARQMDYEVILEPTQQPWLYGIKLAQLTMVDTILDRYDTILTTRPVNQRIRYLVTSYPNLQLEQSLSRGLQERSLQLPEADNPRSRAMAAQLRATYSDDRALIQAALSYFNQEQFFYTLTPPPVSGNSIDAFLFDTRQGFCGHYAGSLVYLLRAAGIPSRVVVGYQGAERNPFEDYLMIYQYNAHAWTEVWLENEGWIRFDPTAWVAPERIIQGVEAFFGNTEDFIEDSRFTTMFMRGTPWLNSLRLRLDVMEYNWNRFVVSYDSNVQMRFLQDIFGEYATERSLIALYLLCGLIFSTLTLFMWWRGRRPAQDPLLALYVQTTEMLKSRGEGRLPAEGPQKFSERLGNSYPQLRKELDHLTELMVARYYSTSSTKQPIAGEPGLQHATDNAAQLRQALLDFRKKLKRLEWQQGQT